MVGLSLADVQSVALPIDVVQRQGGYFAGAEAIGGHEKKNCEIAPANVGLPIWLIEHLLNGFPADRSRDVGQAVLLRNLDQLAEIVIQITFALQVPQKYRSELVRAIIVEWAKRLAITVMNRVTIGRESERKWVEPIWSRYLAKYRSSIP